MKTIAAVILFVSFFSFCSAQPGAATATPAAVKPSATAAFAWGTTSHDFGKTRIGQPVSFEFRFRNTGMAPIVISSVKASCGCTVTAYTKDPVQHGASGFVRATYDAQAAGVYSKTITVYANIPEGLVPLTIKGEIVK